MATVLRLIAGQADRDLIDGWLRAAGHEPVDPPAADPALALVGVDVVDAAWSVLGPLRTAPAAPPVLLVGAADLLEVSLPRLTELVDDVLEWPLREATFRLRIDAHLRSHRLARDLAAAELRAEVATRARARFLAHVSHQMRGPLSVVLGFSRLLGTAEDASADTLESAELIERAGETLLELVDDLVDLSAASAGELSVEIGPVTLARVLGGAVELVGADAEARAIEISLRDTGDLEAMANAGRLRQVLVNLLSNAVRYNRAGGQVSICATRRGGAVEVAVADTGQGIAPGGVTRLLDPTGVLGPREDDGGGDGPAPGVGLTVARNLVEAMGGTIALESTLGEGTTARIRLAAVPAVAPERI
jgi:signal transduction histidine kinase